MPDFDARYNIAPSTRIVVIRDTAEDRIASLMRWSFIPAWAKDPAAVPMLNNARSETVAEKPMFRQAFQRRRCIIPASGLYEWHKVRGQKTKQPFYIALNDGTPMSFAGIWETITMADGEQQDTCAILTTTANTLMQPIHDRMPVMLERDKWAVWLNPKPVDIQELHALMVPPCHAEHADAPYFYRSQPGRQRKPGIAETYCDSVLIPRGVQRGTDFMIRLETIFLR